MHEWSLVQALLDRVEDEARSRSAVRVSRLEIRLGELSGVDADLFAKAFETFREGTLCAGAALDVKRVAARWACPACGRVFVPGALLDCAACDVPAKLVEGGDLFLDRVEMEVEDGSAASEPSRSPEGPA